MAHDESHACACGGACGCQSEQSDHQVYLTPAEYVVRLEQYLADLKAEIVSVEAELAALRAPAGPAAPLGGVGEPALRTPAPLAYP